jgi:hypothetical protein
MNPHSGKNDNNKDRTAKAIAAIPMASIVVAAAFLSGLSLINSYHPAMAQNMTGNATTNATTTGGGISAQSACAPTTTTGGGANATTNATTTGGSSANATAGNASTTTNATSAIEGGGGNQSTSEVREYIEAACMAAQNNDTQGVLMQLNLALNSLGGNATTTEGGEDEGGEDEGGEDEGGEDET